MNFLRDWRLTLVARLLLGGLFIYASLHKVMDPPDFAKIVYNYKLLPGQFLHVVAMILPWIELLAGVAIITGYGLRAGAWLIGLMVFSFILALSFNLYRCHPTICGCFSTHAENINLTDDEKFFKMWREIVYDIGMLLLALQILYATAREGRARATLLELVTGKAEAPSS